jgi:hypothetical protein
MQLMALERSFEPGGFEETVGTGAEKQRQPIRGWLELAAQILSIRPMSVSMLTRARARARYVATRAANSLRANASQVDRPCCLAGYRGRGSRRDRRSVRRPPGDRGGSPRPESFDLVGA